MQERERFSYLLSSGKMPFHHLSSDCTKGCHWRSFCSLQTRQSSSKWSPCPPLGEHQPPISLKEQNQGFNMGPSLGFTPSLPFSAHTLCHCHKAVPHPLALQIKGSRATPHVGGCAEQIGRAVCKWARKEAVCSFYFLWKNILMLTDKTMRYFCTSHGWMDGGIQGLSLNNRSPCLVWKPCS